MLNHKLSSTTLKILNILNDCEVHTGSDMAEALGISRTAVWKIIQRLKKYGVPLQSRHQGYQLNAPLILLDQKKIETSMKELKINVELFENISSTRDYLKNKSPLRSHSLCLAEHQSSGKGRLGRTWASPFGQNIYCSLSFTFQKDMGELSGLSLATGILIAEALESLNLKPLLKWPNDIYLNHQKAGGILVDLIAEAHGTCTAIISVGLNINMKDRELAGVDQPWTSLEHALNEKLDRNLVLVKIIQSIIKGLESFQDKGFDPFLSLWKRYDYLLDKTISINTGREVVSGICRGITPQGYLRLEHPSKNLETYSCGDATLLKK
ncbi:MAG: uncharacterized protein K0R52_505 [Alphaproteobacteria bacterium]|jgi:BirA family biotin operon repressor/biotin-[acetyl-CoA-carboxylase] ligase|nr:uncharacterized protein [Alphaproteobacteria bacterium]